MKWIKLVKKNTLKSLVSYCKFKLQKKNEDTSNEGDIYQVEDLFCLQKGSWNLEETYIFSREKL